VLTTLEIFSSGSKALQRISKIILFNPYWELIFKIKKLDKNLRGGKILLRGQIANAPLFFINLF